MVVMSIFTGPRRLKKNTYRELYIHISKILLVGTLFFISLVSSSSPPGSNSSSSLPPAHIVHLSWVYRGALTAWDTTVCFLLLHQRRKMKDMGKQKRLLACCCHRLCWFLRRRQCLRAALPYLLAARSRHFSFQKLELCTWETPFGLETRDRYNHFDIFRQTVLTLLLYKNTKTTKTTTITTERYFSFSLMLQTTNQSIYPGQVQVSTSTYHAVPFTSHPSQPRRASLHNHDTNTNKKHELRATS